MRVLFIAKEGIPLFQTLLSSETSREALRFYRPTQSPAGVQVLMASMGSALSLTSDLRWYVRRYMRDVLFELSDGVYCTRALAQEIYYGRAAILHTPWRFRRSYTLQAGHLLQDEPIRGKDAMPAGHPPAGRDDTLTLEVWCTEEEYLGLKRSDDPGDEVTSS